MIYITVPQSPQFHQMSLDELLFNTNPQSGLITANTANTRTYEVLQVSPKFRSQIAVHSLIGALLDFNNLYEGLRSRDRLELYENFYIPKHDGGFGALLRSFYKSQGRWVDCDSGAVYAGVRRLLDPLLRQHPATEQDGTLEAVKLSVLDFLGRNGFDPSKIDFDASLSSAFRKIDAPVDSLKVALTSLKTIFEQKFHALYHTSAFAYIHGRSTVDAVKRHQENQSKWFAKYDLHNFFGSTTPAFAMKMLSMIFPFSEVVQWARGRDELEKALDLCFLRGGLPQGTPISPTLTNILMIPVDFMLTKELRDHNNQRFIYTRYADDFQVSSRYGFSFREIENLIVDTLASFEAPFTINSRKTRYGSSSGSNWNLGLMLNGENRITLGHKEKRKLEAAISSYVMDAKNGRPWELHDVQVLNGNINYHKMVEGENIDGVIAFLGRRFGVNIPQMIKADLRR